MSLTNFENIFTSQFQFYFLKMNNQRILKNFKEFKNWHTFKIMFYMLLLLINENI
jgi:hypothetical protein